MGHNLNHGYIVDSLVDILPKTKLDWASLQTIVQILNIILADEAVLSMKIRGARWNAHGRSFLELHTLFEVQNKQLNAIITEVSKHIRMLLGQPLGTFEEFFNHTRLQGQSGEVPHVLDLLDDHESVIHFLHEDVNRCTEELENKNAAALLENILRRHEKMARALRAHIEPELTNEEGYESRIMSLQREI